MASKFEIPKLPNVEQMDFSKMDMTDPDEVNIEAYFTASELVKLSDYEKLRLRNIKRNYQVLKDLGLPIAKPQFMKPKKKPAQKKKVKDESSGSDEEWTPELDRRKSGRALKSVERFQPPPKPDRTVHRTKTKVNSMKDKEENLKAIKTKKKSVSLGTNSTSNIVHKGVHQPRYPKRIAGDKNYKDLEVPDDDAFLYCDECNMEYAGDCPVHGPLNIIQDVQVPADGSDPERARKTLPPYFNIYTSQIPDAGLGVWVIRPLKNRTRFGPYEGEISTDTAKAHESGYSWQVYKEGQPSHFVDAQDPSKANWMRYVNCARTEREQNLVAFQHHGQIYYKTIKPIPEGNELLVWYGDAYAMELGIDKTKPESNLDLLRKLNVEVYECDICGKLFADDEYLVKHRKHHPDMTGSKKYKCAFCNYSTNDVTNHQNHLLTHTGERPHKCEVCGKGFSKEYNLITHKRIHTGEKPYKCTVCGKRFNRLSSLHTHQRIHDNSVVFTCTVCGKQCSVAGNLKKHMRIHTGEKPYKCQFCDRRFNVLPNLKTHMRIHTGEKPYKCEFCDKRFNRLHHLKGHIHVHTGEKPYKCQHCDRGFNFNCDMQKHIRKVHPGDAC